MTHDLFKSFAHSFSYSIQEIIISDLKEGVFFAKIICNNGKKEIQIDARPSDAIAIGLRFDVPIFTYETILSEAGIEFTDESEEEIKEIKTKKTTSKSVSNKDLKDLSVEKLQEMLDSALDKENYEEAAKIRDEINRRN